MSRVIGHRDMSCAIRPITTFAALIILGLSVPTLLAAPDATQDLSAQDIASRARPGVVVVRAFSGSRKIAEGSGFIVTADGKLVTNQHVLQGADQLQVQLASGEIYDVVHFVNNDPRRDLAILRIPETGLKALTIGDDRTSVVGERIYVMGNPLGLEGTFSDGLISAKRTVEGVAVIQITAPISAGSSGGPVLNARGEVIAVATETLREGQNLNIAIPARYAEGLLALSSESQPFEQVAHRFRQSSVSTDATSASMELEEQLENLPSWARDIAVQIVAAHVVAGEAGFEASHDVIVEMLRQGQYYEAEYSFDRPDAEVRLVGVCDSDCSDLDVVVFDRKGTLIAQDVEVDDYPVVSFTPGEPSKVRVRVRMAACHSEPCGFGLQPFTRNKR